MLIRLANTVLDLLFPPRCVLCHAFLEKGEEGICPKCAKSVLSLQYRQRALRPFVRCISALPYEGVYRESIARYKFGGRRFYAETYAAWLAALIREELDGSFDVMTWIPISRKRLRKRGFDQSELLCRGAGEFLGAEVVSALRKTRDNPPQSTMKNAEARKQNVRDVFAVSDPEQIRGKRVLLLDDILTTGNSMQVCARELLRAGAQSVVGCTLASV
ncbi:MAG: ComF family protein [Oscillospiraceae bacterium]|nr:ComF family protein [Oscillospiraceae bacterium]MBR2366754.1 ComF family protein [Oscillospiraceae bacterium]MBR2976925.1 ComF family protein [Oscillospiraceae bacterium]